MSDVADVFLAALAPGARAAFAGVTAAAVDEAIARHVAGGRERWAVATSPVDLARDLAQRLGDAATPELLVGCRGDDVCVALACAAGDASAIARVGELLAREVDAAGTRARARPDQIAEANSELQRLMFTGEPGRSSGISAFSGRGDLRGYVRVIATRELVKIIKRADREQPHEPDDLAALIAPAHDPALSMLRAKYRDAVDACVRAAIGKLGDRERALLRYQIVEGWNVDQIGTLYGVHRATAARWVAAARDVLGALIRKEVAGQLDVAVSEVDSIVQLVQSRLDLSLERLMQST